MSYFVSIDKMLSFSDFVQTFYDNSNSTTSFKTILRLTSSSKYCVTTNDSVSFFFSSDCLIFVEIAFYLFSNFSLSLSQSKPLFCSICSYNTSKIGHQEPPPLHIFCSLSLSHTHTHKFTQSLPLHCPF